MITKLSLETKEGIKMSNGTYEITHKNILESGRKLFLKNGYERTNLRELCKGAGITTGAYYRHFTDKEALFSALVEPVVQEISTIYSTSKEQCFDYIETEQLKELFQVTDDTVSVFVHFIYENFDSFKLLLQCADGTKYVNFVDDIVELEVENSIKMLELMEEHGIAVKRLSRQEFHMLNHTYFSCIFEAVMHDYTEKEVLQYTRTIVNFFTAGWKKVLDL